MSESPVDRTTEVLTKAQAEVQRTSTDLEKAKSSEVRARAEVDRTESVAKTAEATAEKDAIATKLALIAAEIRRTDPNNEPAFRRLAMDRMTLEMKRDALDGAAERAQAEHAKAQTDLDTARAAVARAEEAQKSAQEKHEEADRNHQEAQLVAAGDPSALARKADSDRARAVLDEHLRIVRSHGVFSPGGGPCEIAEEAEKIRTRLSNRQALDANTHGWGTHSEGRNVSPVGFRGNAPEQVQEGFKPYNTQDPLRNE